ncbi:MAG: hypothetical protein HZC54_18050 [Verrucomicrobia bacterium]|nr:hypothetical protein [Verrucomicrobiota bacterium]
MLPTIDQLRAVWRRLIPLSLRSRLWRIRAGWSDLSLRARAAAARKRLRTSKQVVFVADRPSSREAKLAYGLRQNGWQVILLHKEPAAFDLSRCCHEARQYSDAREALELACSYAPVAYHLFSSWNFDVAETLVRYKPGKIVFDDYDVLAGMIRSDYLEAHYACQVALERYCLENADGLCCRSLETQYPKRRMGYRYRGKRLLLLDCCWNDQPVAPRPPAAGELHLVYAGNVPCPETDSGKQPAFVDCAEAITAQGIHLHIYPSHEVWVRFFAKNPPKPIARLLQTNPRFHVHPTVPADAIADEISRFDIAWFDVAAFDDSYHALYTPEKYVYASTNKIFDYLDAGLPIAMNAPKFQEFLVRRLRVGSKVQTASAAGGGGYLGGADWHALRSNVERARRTLFAARQTKRLIAFYNALAGEQARRGPPAGDGGPCDA